MSTEKTTIKIAVLSDVHVGNNDNNSYLTIGTHDTPQENPFAALKLFIQKEKLEADILICCGDMADQANIAGQKFAWSNIKELSEVLKTKHLYGTVGNHDMDSRGTSFDPKGSLQQLIPHFPNEDELYCDRYWSRNFAFSEMGENVRLLNINSCAFHGYGNQNDQEYEHGRISQFTIDKIEIQLKKDLEDKKEYNINIAFFHHHPLKSEHRDHSDYSEMDGGELLLRLLSKSEYGNWIIIHGHKHWPNIKIAQNNSSTPPVIFSAGSFSSKRLTGEQNSAQNQFYIVEVYTNPLIEYELSIAGIISAWYWAYGDGWNKSPFYHSVPYGCGFTNSNTTAQVLANWIDKQYGEKELILWDHLVKAKPMLKFIFPKALQEICDILRTKYNYEIFANQETYWPYQFKKQTVEGTE